MILNNFTEYLFSSVYYNVRERQAVKYKDINGDDITLNEDTNNSFMNGYKFNQVALSQDGNFCIALGTDDTPVTKEDCLWQHDINTLSDAGHQFTCVNSKIRILRTYTNNTLDDITVREVGLIFRDRNMKNILVAREVLPQSYIIKPGGAQVFGIDIG